MPTESFTPATPDLISGTGPYTVPFAYSRSEDLVVNIRLAADDTLIILPTSDWSVAPTSSNTNGNITLSTGAATLYDGDTLTVTRSTQVEQGWVGSGGAREAGLEAQLDVLARAAQDLQLAAANTIRMPADYQAGAPTFPLPSEGFVPIWGPNGTLLNGPSAADIAAAQANAAAAAQDAADAAASAAAALAAEVANARIASFGSAAIQGQVPRVTNDGLSVIGLPFSTVPDLADPGAGNANGLTDRQTIAAYINTRVDALPQGPELLLSEDISSLTDLDFTSFDNTRFISYRWDFSNILLSMIVRTSSDGINYDTGTSDYAYQQQGALSLATTGTGGVPITGLPAAMRAGMSGRMWHTPIVGGAREPIFRCELESSNSGDTNADYLNTQFRRNANYEVQGVRISASSGTFVSGHITVTGFPR